MLNDEDKYYLTDQYLKGKLDEEMKALLVSSFKSMEEFEAFAEMNRIADALITENFYSEIESVTKKVVRKNRGPNWGKISIATILTVVSVGTIYFLSGQKNIKEDKKKVQQHKEVSEKVINKSVTIRKEGQIQTIKPKLPNQTTNIFKAPKSDTTLQPEDNTNLFPDLHPIETSQEENPQLPVKNGINATIQEPYKQNNQETKGPQDQEGISLHIKNEFILNPERGETVTISDITSQNCELIIYNPVGGIIYSNSFREGLPVTWSGSYSTGGVAGTGQYVYLLKTPNGEMIQQGYITVVK